MSRDAWYLDLLLGGKAAELERVFARGPVVHDPLAGHVLGRPALERFVAETAPRLGKLRARVEPVAFLTSGAREVSEALLHLVVSGSPVALPVAVVADRAGDGVRAVRIYHSVRPLTARPEIRAPLLAPDRKLAVAGAVADYLRALAAGDIEGVLAAFEPDATVREAGGELHAAAGLREFYGRALAGGGIPLQLCTASDDGKACALEYIVLRWGATHVPPQAGVAVYVRGATGRLAAVRIYDDVEPPAAG